MNTMERLAEPLFALRQPAEHFIDTFCDPKFVSRDFTGALGKFTPCFTDIIILGLAHLTAIICCIARLIYLRSDSTVPKFHLHGTARAIKFSAIIASIGCLLIVLFQFNARLAANPDAFLNGNIAPFEWADFGMAAVSWALFLAVFVMEIDHYTPQHSWMIRFPILFIFAGQIAKFRFILLLADRKSGYFFYLYVVYFALQAWLALLALFHYPDTPAMTPVDPTSDFAYQQLQAAAEAKTVCPEATSNIFSTLTFSWISPLMRAGFKAPLQFEDIWQLPPDDRVASVSVRFEKAWDEELHKRDKPSLTRACWKATWQLLLGAVPFKLVNDASQFIAPIFINLLLGVVEQGDSAAKGYFYAGLMFVGLEIGTLCDNQHFQRTMRAGFRLRALLVHQVFKKTLFLSPGAQHQFTSGRIFNLVTSDAETLQQLCQNILGVVSSPVRITVAVILLFGELGTASLVALVTLIVMMPIQAVLVRISSKLMRKSLRFTDERAKFEGELLGGIDVVKCSAWEGSFWEHIQQVRNQELTVLWHSAIVAAFNSFLLNSIPVIVSVATFTTYVLLGHNLTAAKAFTALSLFTVLRMPLFQLPQLITQLVNARVALQRLQELLAADQQPPMHELPAASPGETAIEVVGDFSWEEDGPPTLHEVDLVVPQGSLVAVVGSTGSGKSSLLSAALGLMKQLQGPPVELRGKVAFVPQTAFIFGATLRENILFGLPFDESRYQRAVQAAALGPDLVQLPAGDQTELGERGVNVSGGQKQRISIARAVYSEADIVLFDDPLSALDAKVAREVYNGCLREELSNITRVLVTNQLQFVNGADWVIYMYDGRIAEAGTYQELMAAGDGFSQLMAQAEVEEEKDEETVELEELGEKAIKKKAKPMEKGPEQTRAGEARPAQNGTLTEKEARATGRISLHVLWVYIQALGGIWGFTILVSWFILVEAARVGTTVWLSAWTGAADSKGGAPHPALWYLAIYGAISCGQLLFNLLSSFLLKLLSLRAARILHNKMLQKLLRAPMAFFHTTPMGRIINRLTKDTSDVDKNVADFAAFFLRSALQLTSTVGLIGFVTPFALSALVPILLCFYLLYSYFQASVREVKRLDAISRSPVYGSIGEALGGLATIRAYHAEHRLIKRNAELIDGSVIFSLVNQSMNRWLSVRLETLGALSALAAAILAVEQRGSASVFGLVLSYALQITMLTSMTVRLASLMENCFNAVERIDEFCTIKEEAPAEIPGSKPDGWPWNGKVEFQDVKMRYRAGLPLVLHGLTVTVEPGSRCGVVGRTGAGKSSLINCLFRLMELDSGRISIDGVDIAGMGLHQLRSSMSLIPQTPVLFTGSMRSNLDPFNEHSDAEVWTALRRAHLASLVENSPLGLEYQLAEGGAPLSAGQKQLVALARALLRHSKILVLDEATASVDVETDALIQKTVSEEFADCTIIAIAHRLHTVIDFDRVLVMERGTAAEYGSPAELLSKADGVFSGMVAETGEATARFLKSIAFGEVDGKADRTEQAARALTRVSTLPKHTQMCRDKSNELLQHAETTAGILGTCLALLVEEANAEEFRRQRGIELPGGSEGAENIVTVNAAMKQALEYLDSIRSMALQVTQRLNMGAPPPSPRPPPPSPRPAAGPGPAATTDDMLIGNTASTSEARVDINRLSSVPILQPIRRSIDAPRDLAGPDSAPSPMHHSAARRWARLRKAHMNGRRKSLDYQRLASEDPTLSNDPSIH